MENLLIQENTEVITEKYFIGMDMPIEQKFIVQIFAKTPNDNLNGAIDINIKTTPPIDIENSLHGEYKVVSILPTARHILITTNGFPKNTSSDKKENEFLIEPIFHLRIILSEDWKSGVASYDYKNTQGKWESITDAPVKRI